MDIGPIHTGVKYGYTKIKEIEIRPIHTGVKKACTKFKKWT